MVRLSPSNLNAALASVRLARSAPLLTLAEAVKELRDGQIEPHQCFKHLPNSVRAEIETLCQLEFGQSFMSLSLARRRSALVDALTEQAASITPPCSMNDAAEEVIRKVEAEIEYGKTGQQLLKTTPVKTEVEVPLAPSERNEIKTHSTEFNGCESRLDKIEIPPDLTLPKIDQIRDWLKLVEQTKLPLAVNEIRLLPLDESQRISVPPLRSSDGPSGARLASTSALQSHSRAYQPSLSSYSYGYSHHRSRSKIGASMIFGFWGLLLGLVLAGLSWSASWVLHWAFAWSVGRVTTASLGWWIGWPGGVAMLGIVVGIFRDR